MNLYFDIDGVLKGSSSPQMDIEALICYAIQNYPHSVYWLTTHCRGGVNCTRRALNGCFSKELLDQIEDTFQPTDWNVLKTDAIDFSKPFIWFDDTVLQSELDVMDKKLDKEVNYGLFLLDKYDSNSAQDALEYLKIVEDKIKDRESFIKMEDIKTTKIIICGGRHFNDYELLMSRLNDIIESNKIDIKQVEIVSGHCEGADMLGEKCAADLGAKCTVFPAQWKKYGRSAGPIRNKQMVDYIKDCDNPIVLAFVNERTKGTRNTVSLAQKNNIPVFQYEY